MAQTLTRVHQLADLELRGDGRTIVGIAVPFDVPALVRDQFGRYEEVWRQGAFAKTIAERGPGRVKMYTNHGHLDRKLPVGRFEVLREDTAGLYVEGRVSAVPEGDIALELVRDGVLDSMSVGAAPILTQWDGQRSAQSPNGTMAVRTEARLEEISLVAHPAFEGAMVTAVRDTSANHPDDGQGPDEGAVSEMTPSEIARWRLRLRGF